jgi:hypothetical protein
LKSSLLRSSPLRWSCRLSLTSRRSWASQLPCSKARHSWGPNWRKLFRSYLIFSWTTRRSRG